MPQIRAEAAPGNEKPYRECAGIAGYLAFYPDRFGILVDVSST